MGATMPLGVIGNTPDSGSGESWFEPRRGNWKERGRGRCAAADPFGREVEPLERWPSGLRRRPAKAFGSKGSRGFESLPLRSVQGHPTGRLRGPAGRMCRTGTGVREA
jgi:hypothetical protein